MTAKASGSSSALTVTRPVTKLALHRVYAPIAVSTWRADTPRPELPAVEITEDVPADLSELSELDAVRTRLIERVAQRAPQTASEDR
jgi:hypothetical protein